MQRSKNILDLRIQKEKHDKQKKDSTDFLNGKKIFENTDRFIQNHKIESPSIYAESSEDLHYGGLKSGFFFKRIKRYLNNQNKVKYWRILFNPIALFGKFIEKIATLLLKLLRLTGLIVLSPIAFLDTLLNLLATTFKKIYHMSACHIVYLTAGLLVTLKTFKFKLPYFWHKRLGIFITIALALVVPIRLMYHEFPKLITAKERILGTSVQAVKYYTIFQEIKDYVPAAIVAKDLLGFNGPRRYLVVFHNNAELRANLGFMGSYALVDIHNGEITSIVVPTGGLYDLKGFFTRQIEAPKPFHIFSPFWQPWNTNWFAHFPLSSQKLMQFYEWSGGPTVDGVIGLTPNVIENILELTGPVELEDYGQVITKENFREETQKEVEIEYDKDANTPKAFIGDLMTLMIDRVFNLANDGKLRDLLVVLDTALQEKQLLMYSANPEIESLISSLDWSGEIKDSPFDYLQVVHTNIGGGKTDIVIKDFLNYKVTISDDGSVLSTVELTRVHTGDPNHAFEGHDNLDYIRFYVPFGSRLIDAQGFTTDDLSSRFKRTDAELDQDPDLLLSREAAILDLASGAEIFTESKKTVFAHWLGIKPGQTKTVSITYQLPYAYNPDEPYRVYWQKQSGTQGTPINSTISLPDHLRFSVWNPESSHVKLISDQKIQYTNDLRVDRLFSFTVEKADSNEVEDLLEE